MSLLLRVRGFYLSNKQEKNYHRIAWIIEIAASQRVVDRKGNAFIVEKNCYASVYYYHCYLHQTRPSVPVANGLINSLMVNCFRSLVP